MWRRIGSAVPLCVAMLLYASSFESVEFIGRQRLVRGGAVLLALAGGVVYLLREIRLSLLLGAAALPSLGMILLEAAFGWPALTPAVFPSILIVYIASLVALVYVVAWHPER